MKKIHKNVKHDNLTEFKITNDKELVTLDHYTTIKDLFSTALKSETIKCIIN